MEVNGLKVKNYFLEWDGSEWIKSKNLFFGVR